MALRRALQMWRPSGGCGTLHTVSNFTLIQLMHVEEGRSEQHSAHYIHSQQLGSPGSTFRSLAWAAQMMSKATDEQACWHSPERQPGTERLLQALAAHSIGKS
jgi:hypothetical protein